MTSFVSAYGELKAVSAFTNFPDGRLQDCIVNEKSELHTPLGILTPQYEHAGIRSKFTYSVSFFENGKMSRIALNEQTEVDTPIGKFPAELLTFYENGSLKRLFPLNGQISGYWSEEDEYNLAQVLDFELSLGSFAARIIAVCYYQDGAVQSLTFWPQETVLLKTPLGDQKVRIGLSLYPDGSLRSFEPVAPLEVKTPIGSIEAFDIMANGVSGDKNSLNFFRNGQLKSLITGSSKISVLSDAGEIKAYVPSFHPLRIEFSSEDNEDIVCFNGRDKYLISKNRFMIENLPQSQLADCLDCAGCL